MLLLGIDVDTSSVKVSVADFATKTAIAHARYFAYHKNQEVLRDSVICCDSRVVDIGDKAFKTIGEKKCLDSLLNSPGNFTASKLAWVNENERALCEQIDKVLLPGDFISTRLAGEVTTSFSALSEGIFLTIPAIDCQHRYPDLKDGYETLWADRKHLLKKVN